MAATLDRWVDAPEEAARLGQLACARAREFFTAEKVVPRYEALYRGVIARSDRA
jgi:glycosyltransferase involved in cell wall biosynthesis